MYKDISKNEKQFERVICFQINPKEKYSKGLDVLLASLGANIIRVSRKFLKNQIAFAKNMLILTARPLFYTNKIKIRWYTEKMAIKR